MNLPIEARGSGLAIIPDVHTGIKVERESNGFSAVVLGDTANRFTVGIGQVTYYRIADHSSLSSDEIERRYRLARSEFEEDRRNGRVVGFPLEVRRGENAGLVGIKPLGIGMAGIEIYPSVDTTTTDFRPLTVTLHALKDSDQTTFTVDSNLRGTISIITSRTMLADPGFFIQNGFDLDPRNYDNFGKSLSPEITRFLYEFLTQGEPLPLFSPLPQNNQLESGADH
jgi:hypothetical protein